ncbi:hypothetical protein EHQ82_16880 [Leptospira selangorensis]|uniref:Lipoprotein n=1 Tax=Leptospira selangorensis TaxID=2484982 RepID=A0ABY2N4G2_9LEPT|nr:hypothetical protein [Leptospira selangorensis]TGM16776.1 hypothetical protein EHQ82_16880 [Leptospira selangorensis]
MFSIYHLTAFTLTLLNLTLISCSSTKEIEAIKNTTAQKNPIQLDCKKFGFFDVSEIPEISKTTNNFVSIRIEGDTDFLPLDMLTNAKNINNHKDYSQFMKYYNKECKNSNHPYVDSILYIASLKSNSIPFTINEKNLIGKGLHAEQESSLKDFIDAHFNKYEYKNISNSTLNLNNEDEFYHDRKKYLYSLIVKSKNIILETELFKLGTYDFKKEKFPIIYNCVDNIYDDFRCDGLGYTSGNGLKAKDRVRINELSVNVPKEFASNLKTTKLVIEGNVKTQLNKNGNKNITITPKKIRLITESGEFTSK